MKLGNESLVWMLVDLSVAVSGSSERRLDYTTGVGRSGFPEELLNKLDGALYDGDSVATY